MKVDTKSLHQERKSNTYYSNTKTRDQQPDFKEVLMEAIQNVSRNHRLYSK